MPSLYDVKANIRLVWHAEGNGRFMQAFNKACNDAALLAAKEFQKQLRQKLSIRVGKNRAGKVIYRSLPGEAPRRESAKLWRSIKIEQRRAIMQTIIFSDAKYASALKFGDPAKNLMPRPAWFPLFLILYPKMIQIIRIYLSLHLQNWKP